MCRYGEASRGPWPLGSWRLGWRPRPLPWPVPRPVAERESPHAGPWPSPRHAEAAPAGASLEAADLAFLAAETRTRPDTVQEMIDAHRASTR